MSKKQKGLTDQYEGNIIMNESGTSITIDFTANQAETDENLPASDHTTSNTNERITAGNEEKDITDSCRYTTGLNTSIL